MSFAHDIDNVSDYVLETAVLAPHDNYNIWVVEWSGTGGQPLSTRLEQVGYQLAYVASAEQAAERLERAGSYNLPSLLIMDVPYSRQAEARLELLFNIASRRRVPLLALTPPGNSPKFMNWLVDLPADDFMVKPARPTEFLLRVRLLLRAGLEAGFYRRR